MWPSGLFTKRLPFFPTCPRFSHHFTLFFFTFVKSPSVLTIHYLAILKVGNCSVRGRPQCDFSILGRVPPDPINYCCSLTGECISQKYFTYRSVQIFTMLFQGFFAPGSDPPHKIMRYWFYSSTLLGRWFPLDQNGRAEMFCNRLVPAPKRQIGGAGHLLDYDDDMSERGCQSQTMTTALAWRH